MLGSISAVADEDGSTSLANWEDLLASSLLEKREHQYELATGLTRSSGEVLF